MLFFMPQYCCFSYFNYYILYLGATYTMLDNSGSNLDILFVLSSSLFNGELDGITSTLSMDLEITYADSSNVKHFSSFIMASPIKKT